jgi:hypothetical protein
MIGGDRAIPLSAVGGEGDATATPESRDTLARTIPGDESVVLLEELAYPGLKILLVSRLEGLV